MVTRILSVQCHKSVRFTCCTVFLSELGASGIRFPLEKHVESGGPMEGGVLLE